MLYQILLPGKRREGRNSHNDNVLVIMLILVTFVLTLCNFIFLAMGFVRLSVSIPSVSSNALGYGAFLGLYANLRYQLLCGFERATTSYFDVIGVALFFSTALRFVLRIILSYSIIL